MAYNFKIALHKPTGKLMHVDNAENGLACECECLECGDTLEAIQGKIRENHFRHTTQTDCDGAQWVALREFGKQLLLDHDSVRLPIVGRVKYTNPVAEKKLKGFKPDIAVQVGDNPLYLDIYVADHLNNNKDSYVKRYGLNAIEIDLSEEFGGDYDQIYSKVFEDLDTKRVMNWIPTSPLEMVNEYKYLIGAVASSVAAFYGLAVLLRRL